MSKFLTERIMGKLVANLILSYVPEKKSIPYSDIVVVINSYDQSKRLFWFPWQPINSRTQASIQQLIFHVK